MLDNIEQDDDIYIPDLPQVRRVRQSRQNVQPCAAAMIGGFRRQLDPRHLEMPRRLLEEEAVGTSQFQELAGAAITADKVDAASELSAQHRLGSEIIGVTVRMPAGK